MYQLVWNRDEFDIGIQYWYAILAILILENPRKLTYQNIDCIVSYQMQHQYTNILSDNLIIWTKKISLRRIKTDYWFDTEAIIVSEKYPWCCHRTVPTVIVTSSVFQYIEKTTPKINEYQQSYSEPIPTLYAANSTDAVLWLVRNNSHTASLAASRIRCVAN